MKRVLIPVDGSAQSLEAVRSAVREGAAAVERIDLLNVQPAFNRHIARWLPKRERDAWRFDRASQALAEARRIVQASPIPWGTHTAVGPLAATIAGAAKLLRSDEIVVGAKRRGAFENFLSNSLASQLLAKSPTPVRVVLSIEAPWYERLAIPAGLGLMALVFLADE